MDGCLYSQGQELFQRETAPTETGGILFGKMENTYKHEEGNAASYNAPSGVPMSYGREENSLCHLRHLTFVPSRLSLPSVVVLRSGLRAKARVRTHYC